MRIDIQANTYQRLAQHATGFNVTPDDIINKLLDHYNTSSTSPSNKKDDIVNILDKKLLEAPYILTYILLSLIL